jgi:hypothetical protein
MIQRTTTTSATKRLSNTQNEPRVPHRMLLLKPVSFDNNALDKSRRPCTVSTGLRTSTTKDIRNYKIKQRKLHDENLHNVQYSKVKSRRLEADEMDGVRSMRSRGEKDTKL